MTLLKVGFFRELRHGDPDGPSLNDGLGTLGTIDRPAIAAYLRSGSTLAATPGIVGDVLDSSVTSVGAPDVMTDGEWMWPADLAYYVERYGVQLPEAFLSHMRARKLQPPRLSDAELARVTEEFLASIGAG